MTPMAGWRRHSNRFFCAAVALSLWFGLQAQQAGAAQAVSTSVPADRAVLVISPININYPYMSRLFDTFKGNLLQQMGEPVAVYAESLDVWTFDSPAQRRAVGRWYGEKYRDVPLDLVVLIGDASLDFWLDGGHRPDVPVYVLSATRDAVQRRRLPARVTGQQLDLDFDKQLALARRLWPDTDTIVLVGNQASLDPFRHFDAGAVAALASKVGVIDLRGMRYERMLEQVGSLPEHAVVYHTSLTNDGSGRSFDPRRALADMAAAANRPTLTDIGPSIGAGTVGGMVTDPESEGRLAATRASMLLHGVAPSALPMATTALVPRFDWRELQRWDVEESRLPPGSRSLFFQPSAWQQYRWQILSTGAVMLALSALSLALLIERQRRARAVKVSQQRLAEVAHMNRNATASAFSAAIAHELNQPLAAILSNAEAAELLLAQPVPPLASLREIIADIGRDDRRASELIVRMRTLLKPSAASMQRLDLNVMLQQALAFIGGEARLRGVTIKTALLAQPAWVLVDAVQLQQVIINLVINSLDAMQKCMPAVCRVDVTSALVADNMVEVTVTDTGSGFTGDIGRVFESFFTTKEKGMGMGLSISAAIVEAHGGMIIAENVAEGGARIRFQLPLQRT